MLDRDRQRFQLHALLREELRVTAGTIRLGVTGGRACEAKFALGIEGETSDRNFLHKALGS